MLNKALPLALAVLLALSIAHGSSGGGIASESWGKLPSAGAEGEAWGKFPSASEAELTKENAAQEISSLLASGKFGAAPGELRLSSMQEANGRLFLIYNQYYGGVPVFGATSAFLVKNSKLSFARVKYSKAAAIDTSPKVAREEAESIVKADFANAEQALPALSIAGLSEKQEQLQIQPAPETNGIRVWENGLGQESLVASGQKIQGSELAILPYGKSARLAWKIEANSQDSDLLYFIDAHSGEILEVQSRRLYFDVSGRVTGMVWGDPFPGSQQMERNFSGMLIEFPWPTNKYAYPDEGGMYYFTGLSAPNGPITLDSRFTRQGITVHNSRQSDSVHSAEFSADAIHDWNWAADDNSYKDEESNAYYHVLRALDYAESLGVDTMESFSVNVNVAGACNAYYSRYSVNFYAAGSGCESTAVLSDVIYHEYGHGIIDEVDPSLLDIGGYSGESGNLHEGLADYFACSLNGNPDMAEGFYTSSAFPLRRCNTTARYPNNYGIEPHSGAQIISGAMWEIRGALGQNYTDQLLVDALRLQPVAFKEFVESLLAIDDDNADLSDGTPNVQAICDAFLNHGIGAPACAGFTSKPLVEISSPALDDYLRGGQLRDTVQIVGSAYPSRNSSLVNYSLYFGSGGLIASSTLPVAFGSLFDWDTTEFRDGASTLVLNATDSSGQSSQISIGVRLDNIYLSSPLNYDIFRAGDNIVLNGTLKHSSLSNYTVRYARYQSGVLNYSTAGMLLPNGGASEVENGTLAVWNTSAITEKGLYLVEAVAYGNTQKYETLGKIYLDPTLKAGWPVRLQDYYGPDCSGGASCYRRSYFLEPLVEDLDNDGYKEIAVLQRAQPPVLYVFRPEGSLAWFAAVGQSLSQSVNPVAADVDGDGFKEIIAYNSRYSNYSEVYAYGQGGSILPGWPLAVPFENRPSIIAADLDNDGKDEVVLQRHFSTASVGLTVIKNGEAHSWNVSNGAYVVSGLMPFPAVGNFDDDSELEIVAVASKGNGVIIQAFVYVYNMDGTIVDGWPVYMGEEASNLALSSPIVGDIDNDGGEDVLVGIFHNFASPDVRTGGLYAFGRGGSLLPGWPVLKGEAIRASPSLADRGNDGYLEMAVSTVKLSASYSAKTYLFDHQGNVLPGWPQNISDTSYYSTLQADLDGDSLPEVLTTAGTSYFVSNNWIEAGVYAWNTDGTPADGFPKGTEKETAAPAVVADLDSDGKLEIVASSDADYDRDSQKYKNRGSIYVWEKGLPYVSSNSPWPSFQGNSGHNGRYAIPAAQVSLLSPEQWGIQASPNVSLTYVLHSNSQAPWLCTLFVNGVAREVREALPNSTYDYFAQYQNAAYSWSVSCSNANSSISSSSRYFTVAAPPSVALISPPDNSIFNGSQVSLAYTALSQMNSSVSCSLYVDGQLEQVADDAPSGETISYSASYPYGNHSWHAECTEGEASAASQARSFTVAAPPEVTLLSPENSSTVAFPALTLEYSASSSISPYLNCSLYVDGQLRQSGAVDSGATAAYAASYQNGIYSWYAKCTDAAGTSSSQERTFTVAAPPSVALLSPPGNYVSVSSRVNLSYTAASQMNSTLACSLYVNGQLRQARETASGGTDSYSADYQNGNYSWFVECTDATASAASTARNFSVSSSARINIVMPANNFVSNISTVTLMYMASSASNASMTCGVYVNNSLKRTSTFRSGYGSSYSTQFPNGAYSWHVNCTSAIGESVLSAPRTFAVNVTPRVGGGGPKGKPDPLVPRAA